MKLSQKKEEKPAGGGAAESSEEGPFSFEANKPHSSRLLLNPIQDESARFLGNNDTSPLAGMTSTDSQSDGIWLTVVCFVVLIPCLLAACAQSIYCVKKSRQDRIERQVLAVSTNPASRMLVLNEIFKDDGRVSDNC